MIKEIIKRDGLGTLLAEFVTISIFTCGLIFGAGWLNLVYGP